MITTTPDIAALIAAVDAGDDSALCVLADALEETGDLVIARGLRTKETRSMLSRVVGDPAVLDHTLKWSLRSGPGVPRALWRRLSCDWDRDPVKFWRERSGAAIAIASAVVSYLHF